MNLESGNMLDDARLGTEFRKLLAEAHRKGITVSFGPVPDRDDNEQPTTRFVVSLCDHSKPEHEGCWSTPVHDNPAYYVTRAWMHLIYADGDYPF